MVYYSSSLGKIRFNRNILYCKSLLYVSKYLFNSKFNRNILYCKSLKFSTYYNIEKYLIETFCIVNVLVSFLISVCISFNRNILYCKLFSVLKLLTNSLNLIETFCIVNCDKHICLCIKIEWI